MHFINSPEEAKRLISLQDFAVIVSDMRMPIINGAQLLTWAREEKPDTVRLLLTGQADMKDAISVINNGRIFRFLTKPCPRDVIMQTIQDAVEYHYFLTDRRDLIIGMFDSSLRIILRLMEMSDPNSAHEASQRKAVVTKLGDLMKIPDITEVKIAALLLRSGEIGIPEYIREKRKKRGELTRAEQDRWDQVPELGYQLLKDAPRLEKVAEIVRYHCKYFDGRGWPKGRVKKEEIPLGARILKIVRDEAELERRGLSIPDAIEVMRKRKGHYDENLFKIIEAYFMEVHIYIMGLDADYFERKVGELREGQKLYTPIVTKDDLILFPSGTVLTTADLATIENWHRQRGIREPINVKNTLASLKNTDKQEATSE